jgi:hypothetical protein
MQETGMKEQACRKNRVARSRGLLILAAEAME